MSAARHQSKLKLRGIIAARAPLGASRTSDGELIATGTVYAINVAAATVQVGIRGGVVTLPAIADRYVPGGLARILIDPIKARPLAVLGAVNPAAPFVLVGVSGTGTGTVTVAYQGASWTIPAASGTYTVNQSAWVSLDEWGTPILAVGPSTTPEPFAPTATAPTTGATVTATATIGPQVTGTWRTPSGWEQWNVGRYGLGNYPVYQGNAWGSGPLTGFVGYGSQVANLGATQILSITTSAYKNADGATAALIVQGTATGTRPGGAPSSSGDTATTGAVPSGGTGKLAFTANMCEAFRTGAAEGLAAIGSQYGGFAGFGVPPSFVLNITYTKSS